MDLQTVEDELLAALALLVLLELRAAIARRYPGLDRRGPLQAPCEPREGSDSRTVD